MIRAARFVGSSTDFGVARVGRPSLPGRRAIAKRREIRRALSVRVFPPPDPGLIAMKGSGDNAAMLARTSMPVPLPPRE